MPANGKVVAWRTIPLNTASAPLIRYLPANDLGRDFVVGDLHGCRAMLDRQLAAAGFDPASDRLFSVGDLIDRGPDSMGCLALLKEHWFYAVRGNHESMLLDYVWNAQQYGASLGRTSRHEFLLNGGEWIFDQYDFFEDRLRDDLAEALPYVRRLPFLTVVGEGVQRFHIVHADLYDGGKPDEVLLDTDLDALAQAWSTADFANIHPQDYPSLAIRWLWSRLVIGRLASRPVPETLPGLSPTYCGHTIVPFLCKALSHLCIDTGAYLAGSPDEDDLSGGLTLIEVKGQKVYFTDGASDWTLSRVLRS